MSGAIFVSAAVATALATALFGYLFAHFVKPEDRRAVLIAALLAMPLPPILVALIYLPQKWWVAPWLGPGQLSALMQLLTAPLVEEAAKWLVLFAPPVRRALRPDNATVIALAVGFGFAVLEFWTQATSMIGVAAYQAQWLLISLTQPVAWVLAPFIHGGFVLFFANRLAQGRPLWPGALIGIGLHLALNVALTVRWVGPPLLRLTLQALAAIVAVGAYIVLMVAIVRGLGTKLRERMLGKPIACPSCRQTYDRPWAALNFGPISYERCPHCKTLQWVRPAPSKSADVEEKPSA